MRNQARHVPFFFLNKHNAMKLFKRIMYTVCVCVSSIVALNKILNNRTWLLFFLFFWQQQQFDKMNKVGHACVVSISMCV